MNDFLVIGGGIAGVSAGARLSHLGRVTVLEAEAGLGYHTSGRSAALFEESYGKPTTIALNKASKAYFQTANGGVLSPRGLLLVGRAEDADAFADGSGDNGDGPDQRRGGARDGADPEPRCGDAGRLSRRGMGHRHRPADPELRARGPRRTVARC